MPPTVALYLWLALLLTLLWLDPAKEKATSVATWIAVVWIFITASRLPSQWLGWGGAGGAEAMEEGNPADRIILSFLMLLAIGVLISRSFRWSCFFRHNRIFVALLLYGFISVLWSDFALIAAKRWFRDLGNYFVILIVLSDPQPLQALRQVFRRLIYLLVPLSVVLVKYYPYLAIRYSVWTGAPEYVGVTTSKNMLGVMCLISGAFLFWDSAQRLGDADGLNKKKIVLLNAVFIGMTLWLLKLSSSATSQLCLGVSCLIMFLANTNIMRRSPRLFTVSIPVLVTLYLILAFGFGVDINATLAGAVGRDPTLTGRTVIWNAVLSTHTNPLLGTGYESFWLGPRLRQVWMLTGPGINEAHNGYLEVYLNQGVIGLVLILAFLAAAYRTVCLRLKSRSSVATLSLALWTIVPFYNVTESAFKGQLIWVIFLLAMIVVPPLGEHSGDALAGDVGQQKAVLEDAEMPEVALDEYR